MMPADNMRLQPVAPRSAQEQLADPGTSRLLPPSLPSRARGSCRPIWHIGRSRSGGMPLPPRGLVPVLVLMRVPRALLLPG